MYFTKTARKPHFAYESLRYEISTSPNLFRDVPLHYKSNYSGYGYIREKCACNMTMCTQQTLLGCRWWRWQSCCRQGQYVNAWSLNRSMVAAKIGALLQLIHFMLIYHQYEHSSSTTWSFHVVALVDNFEIMGQREVPEQSHQ